MKVKKMKTLKLEKIVPTNKARTLASNKNKKARILATGKGRLLCIVACSTLSACSAHWEVGRGDQLLEVGNSAEATYAETERETAIINVSKTSPDVKPSYYELQEKRASIFDSFLRSLKPQPKQKK